MPSGDAVRDISHYGILRSSVLRARAEITSHFLEGGSTEWCES
jgi:hypothetical protein